jgi:hypothetical protein
MSDMSQVFEMDDIFTGMDAITGLKSFPPHEFFVTTITYCNTSFLCDI